VRFVCVGLVELLQLEESGGFFEVGHGQVELEVFLEDFSDVSVDLGGVAWLARPDEERGGFLVVLAALGGVLWFEDVSGRRVAVCGVLEVFELFVERGCGVETLDSFLSWVKRVYCHLRFYTAGRLL